MMKDATKITNNNGDDSSSTSRYFDGSGSVSEFSHNHYDTSGRGSDEDDGPARPEYINPVVAAKEERAVFWSRLVVIAILSIALAAMATTMFLVISNSEKEDFETQVR